MDYILDREEQATLKLRRIYQSRGYKRYRMSKFEEYDLYAENKDFLQSAAILTFTDSRGKLMALKPDVTMSIIKNATPKDGVCEKVYYNESIYRTDRNGRYKEIMQTGLECIGNIGIYEIFEVISLAAESLAEFGKQYIIDISHMGLLQQIFDKTDIPSHLRKDVLKCIHQKSVHEVTKLRPLISEQAYRAVSQLIKVSPDAEIGITRLEEICGDCEPLRELKEVYGLLKDKIGKDRIQLNTAVINDISYYNGIIFQGFINGIPEKVLSGGQYDNLALRMGKKCRAIGFGITTELLSSLQQETPTQEKILLTYADGESISNIESAIKALSRDGVPIEVQSRIPAEGEYTESYYIENGKVTKIG